MRRPVTSAAALFGAGILAAYYSEINLMIWIVIITGILALYVYNAAYKADKMTGTILILMCIFTLGAVWTGITDQKFQHILLNEGEEVELTGVVKEADYKDNMYNLLVQTDKRKVLIKYYSESELMRDCRGKDIHVKGRAELPQQRRNPGCFDYRLYLKSCGIINIIRADSVYVEEKTAVRYLVITGRIRDEFEKKLLDSCASDKAGLIMGILFGDKSLIDEELYNDFQRNGTAHVLAVSGLHTGILYAFFIMLWRGKKGAGFYAAVGTLLLFYMALADFSPSVVRASLMIMLHITAMVLHCRYDLLSAAGITFIFMLIINPYQLFHTGFQMSFLAIVSLGIIIPFVKYFYQGMFLPAIAIQAGMMPFTAYTFNYISLGAVIANIPVILLAGIILPAGLCALIMGMIWECGFSFLMSILDICCEVLVWINELFYASGKTSFDVISPPVWVLILYYGSVFFCLSEVGQLCFIRRKKEIIVAAGLMICMTAAISVPVMRSPLADAEIVFVDVGQGDCIHVKTPSGRNYLIDGGGSSDYDTGLKVLKPYLLKNGVRSIDAAFVTHLHEDHYGGIKSLAADGMIEKLAVYEANKQMENVLREETKTELIYLYGGMKVELDENCFIEVIAPERETEGRYRELIANTDDENDLSLIMKLNYDGKSVLITGDIDDDGEGNLVSKYGEHLDSDIMKVPHHGSKYSSSDSFVDAVSPVLAVFQVGKNNYGHPAPDVLSRYRDRGCENVRNDKSGAIGVSIDEDTLKVVCMIH